MLSGARCNSNRAWRSRASISASRSSICRICPRLKKSCKLPAQLRRPRHSRITFSVLLAKTQNRPEEAIAAFQKVLRIDPNDVGANVNLGQLYAQQRKYPEAIAVLRTAVAAEPYNATALYNLGTSLMRAGQREEGQKVIAQFQELRQRGTGTTLGTNYLEQGRYAEAIASTGAEPELVDKRTPEVVFTDVTATVLPPAGEWPADEQSGGAALLFDYDLDGDLDLLEVAGTKQRLVRNDAGKFTDVTAQSGSARKSIDWHRHRSDRRRLRQRQPARSVYSSSRARARSITTTATEVFQM